MYRVAHHVAASHVIRERRICSKLVTLEAAESIPINAWPLENADQQLQPDRVIALIQQLKPIDRPVGLPFLGLVVVWIVAYFVLRSREQRQLQREIEELEELGIPAG